MVLSAPTYQYSIATPGCIHGPSGPYLLSGKTAGMSAHILYSGSEIHYKIAGAGSAVVLLHGFGEDSSIWSNQVEHLKDNFKLIIPDLPGSGRSEKIQINRPSSPESDPEIANTSEIPNEVTLETYAAIIKKILEKENIARCVMIGHSMGGYITLAFAEMYPHTLQGLGLFHSSAYADTTDKITTRLKAIEFIKENGVAAFFNTSIPTLFGALFKDQHPGKIDQLVKASRGFEPEVIIQYYNAMIQRPDRIHILQAFNKPVFFIIGEQDSAIPLQSSLKQCHIPAVSFITILANVGHMGMWEEPVRCNNSIQLFLRNC